MPWGWKQRIIGGGLRAVRATRAERWLAPVARGCGVILTFHHVRPTPVETFRPNALLEVTPEFLDCVLAATVRLGYALVPLSEVPDRLRSRARERFVALTFDDGYRDNRDHALPVLRRYGAPWTMFVTTDYAAGTGRLWWAELEEVVRRKGSVVLDEDGTRRVFPAGTLAEKRAAFSALYRDLRLGSEERLRKLIARWCGEIGLDSSALVRRLCLSWAEIADMADKEPGFSVGAHAVTHAMLAKHGPDLSRREIIDSRRLIAERLGREVDTFSYPVGDPTSAGAREFAFARDAGFRVGVTTRPGHLFPAHAAHPTALPRVSVNGLHQSEAAILALLSGVPTLAWNRGRRLLVE